MPEVQTTKGSAVTSWDPWKMFDVTPQELEQVKKRKALAAEKKAEFRMIKNNPAFLVNGGRGGHITDPALQRWDAARATYGDFFRVNKRNTKWLFGAYIIPIFVTYAIASREIRIRDEKNRRGEIPMKDKCFRAFLFI
ncbi:uncharacterized protein LOC123551922 [Mercenaria mercenaria]|uniref:uncharacterized protein LOC123551922 n=1 Tax=Mercenaria mercenaria TaxID=6596 RepID=UPI001E1DB7C2|nr:uncharacterized protein LOC123551922 [Mercenaria mercenaria]